MKLCSKEGCTKPHSARQLCAVHYTRWWETTRHKEPPTPEALLAEMQAAYDEAVSG